jgi:23S rRNA (cytosine1962-C5)-methyltransferase
MKDLERAWNWREKAGILFSSALRVFHGPGEGRGEWAEIAIDRFGSHYWVTLWAAKGSPDRSAEKIEEEICRFLAGKGADSIVSFRRPLPGASEPDVTVLHGNPPDASAGITIQEGKARFKIRLKGAKHPGLFLDHAPLRTWLTNTKVGETVLNTFAYTGSLSVAAKWGGAKQVITLDLSRPTLDWARENWKLNGFSESEARFIAGDVFEWLPRLKKEGSTYDCVILDPPSFSRGKKGSFSTAKDLRRLHELALGVLAPEGMLITSINSANIPADRFLRDVLGAATSAKKSLQTLQEIDLPASFPTRAEDPASRYLKGWIFRVCG